MTTLYLLTNDDGSGDWVIQHPDLGPLYKLLVDRDEGDEFSMTLVDLRNDRIIDEDTLTATSDAEVTTESPEAQAFRNLIETSTFDDLDPDDRELFLLGVAQLCLTWITDRKNF